MEISKLSSRCRVRALDDADADAVLGLCLGNPQYYRYCGRQPSREQVLEDLHITPPGKDAASKHYVGFYADGVLAAVMDLVEGYPDSGTCFIGFFMVDRELQGRGTGSRIIREACRVLKECGFSRVMLGIDKGNPQSGHFWEKNGFAVIRETELDGRTVQVAGKTL